MTSFTLRSAPAICSVIFFCLAPLSIFAQSPATIPPNIVYKLRGQACIGAYSGVPGGTDCTTQATTYTNLSRAISDASKEAFVNAAVTLTDTSNSLQAQMAARITYPNAGGPSFITAATSFLDVEVLVKDTPTDIYTIVIDGTSTHNEFTRSPRSGGFGCPCGTQNSMGSATGSETSTPGFATSIPGLTLSGTASELGSEVVTLPEYPGVNYRVAYQRNVNDWDYRTSANGGINDWDFDAGVWADASLSLNIYATSRCMSGLQLVCNPIRNPIGGTQLSCPTFIAKHCFFVLTFPDGTKQSLGAYNRGTLTPEFNNDRVPSPADCTSNLSDLSRPYCRDLPYSCEAFRILLDAKRRGAGTYNQATNNSNFWVKKRLAEMGLTHYLLPASAPTNLSEYCTQKENMISIMLDECGYEAILRNYLIGSWFTESCP